MKKIIIALVVVVAVVLAIPFVGNKIVQDEIAKNLEELSTYGIKTQERTSNNTYLKTKDHLEFFIEDGDKFLSFLNKYSASQIPPYSGSLFNGTLVGVDLEYWNFPISDALAVTIYPLELPFEIKEAILKENHTLGIYLENFFKNKTLVYQLNFNVARGGFDGYLKDIKENLTLDNGAKVSLDILGMSYQGEGEIISPTKVSSKLDKLSFKASKDLENIVFEMNNITTDSIFKSEYSYKSTIDAKSFYFKINDFRQNVSFDSKDFSLVMATDTSADKIKAHVETSLKEIELKATQGAINIKDFNHALYISDVDKTSYEAVEAIIKKAKDSLLPVDEVVLQESLIELLLKGVQIDLKDLSIGSITIENKDLKAIKLKAKIIIKPTQSTNTDLEHVMLLMQKNISVDARLEVSKEIFGYISAQAPLAGLAVMYAKDEGDKYVFEVKFGDDELSINGKPL